MRVVINAIEMIPELLEWAAVGVDELDVIADHAVVGLGRVILLNEVIPDVPLPDNPAVGRAVLRSGLHFNNGVGQQITAAGGDANLRL